MAVEPASFVTVATLILPSCREIYHTQANPSAWNADLASWAARRVQSECYKVRCGVPSVHLLPFCQYTHMIVFSRSRSIMWLWVCFTSMRSAWPEASTVELISPSRSLSWTELAAETFIRSDGTCPAL